MNGDDIDWARLLNPYRGQSISSSKDAQDVLVAALGPDAIAAGVDHYLDNWMNDTEVLRYVFKILQPASATNRLLVVLQDDRESADRRQAAADLLAVTMNESDLLLLETLVTGDSICQAGVVQVLNQLRWNIDCTSAPCALIVERCVEEGTAETLMAALRIAPIAYEEASNNRTGLLSVDDVIEVFTVSLNHTEHSVLENALSSLPIGLIPTFESRLRELHDEGGDLSQLALEVLNR